jgi:hypothetical protein
MYSYHTQTYPSAGQVGTRAELGEKPIPLLLQTPLNLHMSDCSPRVWLFLRAVTFNFMGAEKNVKNYNLKSVSNIPHLLMGDFVFRCRRGSRF